MERSIQRDWPPAAENVDGVHVRRLAMFEDRYGVGSYERLLRWLGQPCVTFAEIAARLNVTRERVRQWQLLFVPGAPTGRERRRQCVRYRQRRQLLNDRVFGAFYRHVRRHFEGSRITLIRSKTGYRTGIVRVDGHLLAIREGILQRSERSGPAVVHDIERSADRGVVNTSATGASVYRLGRYRGRAEFVYFQLDGGDFLVIPAALLSVHGAIFSDGPTARFRQFKNTFSALRTQARQSA